MARGVKNPASWFCANCFYVPPSQFWNYCENCFLSYVCYRVWPIRGLAWLPWQPDWNDNHFQKVRVMGFVVVYHSCGLAFRKVLKFDVENWAVDHWTPPLNIGKNTRAPMEACISGVRPYKTHRLRGHYTKSTPHRLTRKNTKLQWSIWSLLGNIWNAFLVSIDSESMKI